MLMAMSSFADFIVPGGLINIGLLAALGSAMSWSLGSILFARLGKTLPSDGMTAAKGILSLLFLGIAIIFAGHSAITKADLLVLIVSGVIGIAAGDTLFFAALKRITPHAVVTIMMAGHVLTVLGAVFFLGEAPSQLTWVGIAAVLTGVFVVLHTGASAEDGPSSNRTSGIILGFFAVLAMAASILIAKPAFERTSTLSATFIRMVSGTAFILLYGLCAGQMRNWVKAINSKALLLKFSGAVAVITFGGFWLSIVAFKHADVSVANSLLATEPLFVLALSRIFMGIQPTPKALMGSILTVAGVICILLSTGNTH